MRKGDAVLDGPHTLNTRVPETGARHSGSGPAACALDPYAGNVAANPYPHYAALRDAGPVLYLEAVGVYGVARHAETLAVLNDHASYISGAGAGIHKLKREKAWRPRGW